MSHFMVVTSMMPLVAGVAAFTKGDLDIGHKRMALLFSVAFPSTVYALSAAAIYANSFPAFVVSYGVLGGLGFFCGYPQLPPFLSSKWFPDRPGLALGIYFSAFGMSVPLIRPVLQEVLAHYREPPVRLGGLEEISVTLGEHGETLAMVDGRLSEVVKATATDLVRTGFSGLEEGVFVIGTGSNGVCETMVVMGGGIFAMLQLAAWSYRLPQEGWQPFKAKEKKEVVVVAAEDLTSTRDVTVSEAKATPTFFLLLAGSTGVCMTGLPFLQMQSLLVNDMFGSALGQQTTVAVATTATLLGVASAGGRLAWGPISDKIGCSNTTMLFGASVGTILLTPYATSLIASDPSTALLLFQTSAFLSVAIFGGMPVLLAPAAAEVFGKTHSPAIYKALWLSVPTANLLGTAVMTKGRESAAYDAVTQLATNISDSAFLDAFGGPKSELDTLIANKTITIPTLLKLSPPGTPDPTPFLYNEMFQYMAGASALALLCNVAAFKLPTSGRKSAS